MSKPWPKDNEAALIKFYGTPKTASLENQLVRVKPPYTMYYDGKAVSALLIHKKIKDAAMRAFNLIWEWYEKDQKEIDRLKISEYGGAYNPRKIAGSNKWSNHAFGAAFDIYPSDNGFGKGRGKMPLPVVAAFKATGAEWGGEYRGRTDPMHFEYVDRGSPVMSFNEWLTHYAVERAPKGIVGQKSPHNKKDPVLEITQQRLHDLGYFEVGDVDGLWGGRTRGAIAAFKNDRHLADKSEGVSKALLAELDKAEGEGWTRPVAPKRSEATVEEVKEEVSEMVPADQGKKLGVAAAATSATGGVVSLVGEKFNEALPWIETLKGFFIDVPGYIWFGLAAGVALGLAWYLRRTSNRIQKAYQSGERN